MKGGLETARSRLTRLATTRLLSARPQACERGEHQAVVAIEKSDWRAARMALHLRLKMRCAPTAKECPDRAHSEADRSSRAARYRVRSVVAHEREAGNKAPYGQTLLASV